MTDTCEWCGEPSVATIGIARGERLPLPAAVCAAHRNITQPSAQAPCVGAAQDVDQGALFDGSARTNAIFESGR